MKPNLDPVLRAFADTEGTPLTLFVKGNVITGVTMKSSVYARRLGNPDGVEPAPYETLAAGFEETEAKHQAVLSRDDLSEKGKRKALRKFRRRFIILTGARFLFGSSGFQPNEVGCEVRVRLNQVDGWIYGEMSSGWGEG